MQLLSFCLADAQPTRERNGVVAAAQRYDSRYSTQIQGQALQIQDSALGITLTKEFRERLQKDGYVVEELLGEAGGRVLQQLGQLRRARDEGLARPVS